MGQLPATKLPAVFALKCAVPQLSVAVGNCACAAAIAELLLHSSVVFNAVALVVHVGAVLSVIVITCVNTVLVLPQSSVAVHVLL